MAKAKQLTRDEFGEIRRFPLENVLRPRLLTRTESIGDIIFNCLLSTHQHWMDSSYGKSPDPGFLIFQLSRNLKDEVEAAWQKFLKERRKA